MLRARLEVGRMLKKTLREIDAMPYSEFLLWVQLILTRSEERKKSLEKGRKR